jgi:hypothetical protein
MLAADWGSVPDWLSGIGAIIALAFAGVAARAALQTNRQQNEQLGHLRNAEDQRVEDRRRSQAGKIAAWIALDQDASPAVLMVNGSGLPVYTPLIACRSRAGVVRTAYSYKGPNSEPKRMNRATEALEQHFEAAFGPLAADADDWARMMDDGVLRCAVSFRDTDGQWWFRDVEGVLHERPDGVITSEMMGV